MTGLDIEGVLAGHEFQPTTPPYGWCRCGGSFTAPAHRAHVAAVLREQVAEAQAEAWDKGYLRAVEPESDIRENPYRAAQLAPARVPSEEG